MNKLFSLFTNPFTSQETLLDPNVNNSDQEYNKPQKEKKWSARLGQFGIPYIPRNESKSTLLGVDPYELTCISIESDIPSQSPPTTATNMNKNEYTTLKHSS